MSGDHRVGRSNCSCRKLCLLWPTSASLLAALPVDSDRVLLGVAPCVSGAASLTLALSLHLLIRVLKCVVQAFKQAAAL